jgi:hypothetical protein
VEINFRLPGVTESLDEGIDPRARQKIFLKKTGCATVEDPILLVRQQRFKVVSKDGLQGKDGRRKLLLKLFHFY